LTADRVYREAWPAERALALLENDSGQAFDPACVGALRSIVDAEERALSPVALRGRRTAPSPELPAPRFGEAAA
jgi:HD-GYP domain-containing protein (c-di-GMP phosphodiesterase class II)